MADIPAGGHMAGPERAKAVETLANWTGAAISVALIVGVGIWGYRLLVRDVSGVPVVRAAHSGPMRVQPETPGGRPALHQGLAVNNVAAQGSAAAPADRLVLAPSPIDLDENDAAMGDDIALAVMPAPEPVAPVQEVAQTERLNSGELSPQMASIRALAEQLANGTQVLTAPTPVSVPAPEAAPIVATIAPLTEPSVAPQTNIGGGGLVRSIRPKIRPQGLKASVINATTPATTIDVAAASVPAGTRLVQLGAYDSAEIAKKEWTRISTKFGDYLEGKQRVIQKSKSGGRTFYRLRAMGFSDINDARRFCSALVAERADCIPVTTR